MAQAGRIALTLLFLVVAPLAGASAHPLAGTWRATQDGQAVEITIAPDGSFARRDSGRRGADMTVSGRWTLAESGDRLRVVVEDWAPRRDCGLFGCAEIRVPPTETYRFTQPDRDRLVLEDQGGRTEFRRAG